jgi:chromosome segregation ATPase
MAVTRKLPEGVTDALSTLSYRIEKTESDFIGHLQKVETKLEQIADLARTVAVLQQQTNQQHDQLSELRAQNREQVQKYEQSINRVDNRIDEMHSQVRDRFELANREQTFKLTTITEKTENVESELTKWLNRGVGAWAILAIAAGIVWGGFYRWVDNIESSRDAFSKQSQSAEIIIEKHSQQLEQLVTITKEQQAANQGIQKTLSDLEIRLEQMNFKVKTTKGRGSK